MILNECMMRYNFIAPLKLKVGSNELSKELKAKLMSMRIELGKMKSNFEADCQEALKELKPDGFDELAQKQDKTEQEKKQLEDWEVILREEYNAFVVEKLNEEASFTKKFTEEEYAQIVDVNSDVEAEIQNVKLPAADFLEAIYALFVEE